MTKHCEYCNYSTDEDWRLICPICGATLQDKDYINDEIGPKEVTHDYTAYTFKFKPTR
jgi:hypothetical protein